MATSAKCTYSAVPTAGVFNYEVWFHNTSPAPYDVYSILFGNQFDVDLVPFTLKEIVFVSSRPGWTGILASYGIYWETLFQGNSIASGYIRPGQYARFVFQSSTAPPDTLPFGLGFYDNDKQWGFGFNGTADLVDVREHLEHLPAIGATYNPWWRIETRGGLVPPGPPLPWLQEFGAAQTLAGIATRVSPQLRAGVLELALEQISIASAAVKKDIKALQ